MLFLAENNDSQFNHTFWFKIYEKSGLLKREAMNNGLSFTIELEPNPGNFTDYIKPLALMCLLWTAR